MDKLKHRLRYYGIGFGLGLIIVIFFFQNRGCSWLPGNRVKNAVLDRVIVVSEETEKELAELGFDDEELLQVLNDGEVLFSESEKEKEPKTYLIEKDGRRFAFTLPKESFVSEVFVNTEKVPSPTTEGVGKMIHFPKDEHLVFPDTTDLVTCQQEYLNLIEPKKILALLEESGKIDFEKSDLKRTPKPEHYLYFEKDGAVIGVKAIWYKNKINISTFEAEDMPRCN